MGRGAVGVGGRGQRVAQGLRQAGGVIERLDGAEAAARETREIGLEHRRVGHFCAQGGEQGREIGGGGVGAGKAAGAERQLIVF